MKKSPRKKIEEFSNVFIQLGLVLGLFVAFVSLEHKTEKTTAINDNVEPIKKTYTISKIPPAFVVERPQKKVSKQQLVKKQPVILNKIEKIKNEKKHIDKVILKPADNEKKRVTPDDIIEADEPEIIKKIKPVNIAVVEEIPVFAGCEGLTKIETRKCFDKKIQRLVQRYFNINLANELGLSSGKKRIFTQFVIDKNGIISDVKVNAPHPSLEKETKRIVKKIPKFTPGKHNGKAVKVKYTLPITFKVE